ncbi:ABC transporter ATP-binding protein [Mesorhizobium sp. VK4C]|uniref:ABC transporter ATP-binding protein n=1 Tax=Mesorhizobium captivum TaxID=3072319 RepID=UPI002A246DBD|nr:ABC transporter ATP-binding protein [Mesorhizobium sp. VK4C]MDX8497989.1 ABC transporter ATP-binding protein [Mesorhizobium sp. VK4C]
MDDQNPGRTGSAHASRTAPGTSGCGKSTLLSIVAGLQDFDAGDLDIDGAPILKPGLDRGVVFQSYTLPWLTAQQNIEFALKAAGYDRSTCRRTAREHLDLVKLSHCADLYPSGLSGGMKERVAIARALSYRPKMLLMDEPFGALDALTRHQMQELLTQIWEEHRLTVLFVTHDVEEAVYLSDRIVVMGIGPGRIMRTFNVDIERPRREEVMESAGFMDLQRKSTRRYARLPGPRKWLNACRAKACSGFARHALTSGRPSFGSAS